MHDLIDRKSVENINRTGCYSAAFPDRKSVLAQYDLPYDRKAENAVITGCQILALLPDVLATLSRIFDKRGFSHTFLSEEYCCGNYLYRPAIKARDERAMDECRELSKGFVSKTIASAQRFGVKRLVIFCSPCYPIYKHAAPEEDIIFYPQAIDEVLEETALRTKIDFYAGCYRLHRKFSAVPMDLASTDRVFDKISGLEINRISAPACCYKPEGVAHMIDNVVTDQMVHICTGCYARAMEFMPGEKAVRIMMLPEFLETLTTEKPL